MSPIIAWSTFFWLYNHNFLLTWKSTNVVGGSQSDSDLRSVSCMVSRKSNAFANTYILVAGTKSKVFPDFYLLNELKCTVRWVQKYDSDARLSGKVRVYPKNPCSSMVAVQPILPACKPSITRKRIPHFTDQLASWKYLFWWYFLLRNFQRLIHKYPDFGQCARKLRQTMSDRLMSKVKCTDGCLKLSGVSSWLRSFNFLLLLCPA